MAHQDLHGQMKLGSSRHKLVELVNGDGEESGFVMMEILGSAK